MGSARLWSIDRYPLRNTAKQGLIAQSRFSDRHVYGERRYANGASRRHVRYGREPGIPLWDTTVMVADRYPAMQGTAFFT